MKTSTISGLLLLVACCGLSVFSYISMRYREAVVEASELKPPEPSLSAPGAHHERQPAPMPEVVIDPSTSNAAAPGYAPPARISDGFTPTFAGLKDCTVDLWEQEDFLALPWDVYSEWLPADEAWGRGPDTLGEYVGGLPTDGDIDNAMLDPTVVQLLTDLCVFDLKLASAYGLEPSRRGERWYAVAAVLREGRRSASMKLMQRLEHVTSYPHWTMLWTMYEEWSRD